MTKTLSETGNQGTPVMAQEGKALANKPDDVSSSPSTHTEEEELTEITPVKTPSVSLEWTLVCTMKSGDN